MALAPGPLRARGLRRLSGTWAGSRALQASLSFALETGAQCQGLCFPFPSSNEVGFKVRELFMEVLHLLKAKLQHSALRLLRNTPFGIRCDFL